MPTKKEMYDVFMRVIKLYYEDIENSTDENEKNEAIEKVSLWFRLAKSYAPEEYIQALHNLEGEISAFQQHINN